MKIIQLRAGILILLLQLLLPCFATAGSDSNGLVVFGDSLSDTGNKYYITKVAHGIIADVVAEALAE